MSNKLDPRFAGGNLESFGLLSAATGDLFYADGPASVVRLPKGTAGQYLSMNGGADAPEWATFPASVETSGVWTPAFTINNSPTGITHSVQTGTYVKIGNIVLVSAQVTMSNKGASAGFVRVTGFPFAVASQAGLVVSNYGNFASLTGMVHAYLSGTSAILYQSASGGSALLSEANVNNTADFRFSAAYTTA